MNRGELAVERRGYVRLGGRGWNLGEVRRPRTGTDNTGKDCTVQFIQLGKDTEWMDWSKAELIEERIWVIGSKVDKDG
jgi:hypothetical protein